MLRWDGCLPQADEQANALGTEGRGLDGLLRAPASGRR